MSTPTPTPLTVASPAPPSPSPVTWPSPERQAHCMQWLQGLRAVHGVRPETLRVASADASFRRYLRVDVAHGPSLIVMDAPPDKENSAPFVQVAGLMHAAGLCVPQVLDWQAQLGFMLLTDLGDTTLMAALQTHTPEASVALFGQATDALVQWQLASRPGVLPAYDEALLRRELALFPDWYVAQHKQFALQTSQRETLERAFATIVRRNLAAPSVYVHRDFMPRNLMVLPAAQAAAQGALPALGVLDFQDAVHGPLTYDIACLMRDAFVSWEEPLVLDVTIRYWEKARKAGLMDFEDWHSDFGAFYRAVEWMGLQRHLKVAGIFARLTLRDGKPKYLADAPRFVGYIRATAHRYRELGPLLKLLDTIEGQTPASGWAFGRV